MWVSERLHDIIDAEPIDECKCGKPRVRVTFRNGFKISVHDDGSFIQWTGEMG